LFIRPGSWPSRFPEINVFQSGAFRSLDRFWQLRERLSKADVVALAVAVALAAAIVLSCLPSRARSYRSDDDAAVLELGALKQGALEWIVYLGGTVKVSVATCPGKTL
jgi:hypothetical protein